MTAPESAQTLVAPRGLLKAIAWLGAQGRMKQLLLALGWLFLATPSCAAVGCAPTALVKVVTRNVTPGVLPASFAAKPVVIYRSGNLLLRNEESADPDQGLHLLAVMHAPDVWYVNLADRTGKHIVDPGPSIDVHAPIVSGQGVAPAFSGLEYGCEADFVRANMPKPEASMQVAGTAVAVHRLRAGVELLELKMAAGGRPVELSYFRGSKPLMVIHYDDYLRNLPPNPTLFTKPEGFAYTEERPTPNH